jgi:hypothetical protein
MSGSEEHPLRNARRPGKRMRARPLVMRVTIERRGRFTVGLNGIL